MYRWGDNIKEVRWKDVGWIRLVQEAGTFEHGNEPVGSIKRGEILVYLWTIRFGKKDYSIPWSWLCSGQSITLLKCEFRLLDIQRIQNQRFAPSPCLKLLPCNVSHMMHTYSLIISVPSFALTHSSISPFTSIRAKVTANFLMTATPILHSTKTLPEQNSYTSLTHITGRN
jgi:hypothetical protein